MHEVTSPVRSYSASLAAALSLMRSALDVAQPAAQMTPAIINCFSMSFLQFAPSRPDYRAVRASWRSPKSERALCRPPLSVDPELFLQDRIDRRRIGLAAGRFHHLSDEPAEGLGLFLDFARLIGVRGDNRVDRGLDRTCVRDLFEALFLDDFLRIAPRLEHDREDVLGDPPGNRVIRDEIDQLAELRGGNRRVRDLLAALVERAEKLGRHPVRGE